MSGKTKKKILEGLAFGSAAYVVAHATWAKARGRKPSAAYFQFKNPETALKEAAADLVKTRIVADDILYLEDVPEAAKAFPDQVPSVSPDKLTEWKAQGVKFVAINFHNSNNRSCAPVRRNTAVRTPDGLLLLITDRDAKEEVLNGKTIDLHGQLKAFRIKAVLDEIIADRLYIRYGIAPFMKPARVYTTTSMAYSGLLKPLCENEITAEDIVNFLNGAGSIPGLGLKKATVDKLIGFIRSVVVNSDYSKEKVGIYAKKLLGEFSDALPKLGFEVARRAEIGTGVRMGQMVAQTLSFGRPQPTA